MLPNWQAKPLNFSLVPNCFGKARASHARCTKLNFRTDRPLSDAALTGHEKLLPTTSIIQKRRITGRVGRDRKDIVVQPIPSLFHLRPSWPNFPSTARLPSRARCCPASLLVLSTFRNAACLLSSAALLFACSALLLALPCRRTRCSWLPSVLLRSARLRLARWAR